MKKKVTAVLLTLCMLGTISACGAKDEIKDEAKETKTEVETETEESEEAEEVESASEEAEETDGEYLSEDQIQQLFENPALFEGEQIQLTGKVIEDPTEEDGAYVVRAWRDPKNEEHEFAVRYYGTEKFERNYVLKVTGAVEKPQDGVPVIKSDDISILLGGSCCSF